MTETRHGMDLPINRFKHAIGVGSQQVGMWCSLPGGTAAEVLAGAGYDWILFDTELWIAATPTGAAA